MKNHEDDVTAALALFHMTGSNQKEEWELERLVAFIHVVDRLKKYITDPSSIKLYDKVLALTDVDALLNENDTGDEKVNADNHIAARIERVEVALQNLNKLYRFSIEQKISLPRFLAEIDKDWGAIDEWIVQNEWNECNGHTRHEMLLEWMALTEEGLKLISIVEKEMGVVKNLLRP